MASKILMGVVGIAVSTIVLATVLMPVLDDVTTTTTTLTNEGYFKLSLVNEDTNALIEWDHTDPYKIVTDGNVTDLSALPQDKEITIFGSNHCVVRFLSNSSDDSVFIVYNGGGGQNIAKSTESDDLTIAIGATAATWTKGETTRSPTYTEGFYADPVGDYVMKYPDRSAYVKDDTLIIAGMSTDGNTYVGLFGSGNVDDGMSVANVATNQPNITFGDVTINAPLSEYPEVYDLSSMQFMIYNSTDSSSFEATYSYFAVPAQITAELPQHMTTGEISVLMAIPVIIILGILLFAASMIFRGRE